MDIIQPEKVGFSSERLNRLIPLMQTYVAGEKVPGLLISIARRGKIAFQAACGVVDIATQQPMPLDGIFRLASQTKPITAVAAMILYEHEKLKLSDPLATYLPEFAHVKVCVGVVDGQLKLVDPKRLITIEDLLTFQSGISPMSGSYPIAPELQALYDQAGLDDPNDNLETLVGKIAKLPLCDQPGQAWYYGDSFEVLARVIEVVAGMPYAEFLQQQIFAPLGMEDTGYFIPPEKADRLVRGYTVTESGMLEDLGEKDRSERLKPRRLTAGGAGLLSTALDYQRFAQMLANGGQLEGRRILGRKTIEFMTANRLRTDQLPFWPFPDTSMAGYGYGLGVRVLMDTAQLGIPASVGEFGWSGWFNTGIWIDPKEQLSGVLMAQVAPPQAFFPHIPPLEVRRIVYQAIDD